MRLRNLSCGFLLVVVLAPRANGQEVAFGTQVGFGHATHFDTPVAMFEMRGYTTARQFGAFLSGSVLAVANACDDSGSSSCDYPGAWGGLFSAGVAWEGEQLLRVPVFLAAGLGGLYWNGWDPSADAEAGLRVPLTPTTSITLGLRGTKVWISRRAGSPLNLEDSLTFGALFLGVHLRS